MTPALQPIGPGDCAFLITLPSTKKEFLSDVADLRRDFLSTYFHSFGRDFERLRPEAKWKTFQAEAREIGRTLTVLRKAGFAVRERATAADLARVMGQYPAVILFTHWRSDFFRTSDIRDAAAVRHVLEGQHYSALADGGSVEEDAARALNLTLREMVMTARKEFEETGMAPPSNLVLLRRARIVLAERLQRAAGGGGSIEFCDGMYPVDDLIELLPVTFKGVLDLSVCNSLLLAEGIKREIPGCVVVATELSADLHFNLNYYASLAGLIRNRMPYMAAATRLRRAILQELGANNGETP